MERIESSRNENNVRYRKHWKYRQRVEIVENFVPVSKKQTVKRVTKSLLSIGGYALIILFLIITIRDIGRL